MFGGWFPPAAVFYSELSGLFLSAIEMATATDCPRIPEMKELTLLPR